LPTGDTLSPGAPAAPRYSADRRRDSEAVPPYPEGAARYGRSCRRSVSRARDFRQVQYRRGRNRGQISKFPVGPRRLTRSSSATNAVAAKQLKLLWLGAGDEDFALKGTKAIDELLTKNGVKHSFTIRPGYRHEWRLWRQDLWEFAPLLFQEGVKGTQ